MKQSKLDMSFFRASPVQTVTQEAKAERSTTRDIELPENSIAGNPMLISGNVIVGQVSHESMPEVLSAIVTEIQILISRFDGFEAFVKDVIDEPTRKKKRMTLSNTGIVDIQSELKVLSLVKSDFIEISSKGFTMPDDTEERLRNLLERGEMRDTSRTEIERIADILNVDPVASFEAIRNRYRRYSDKLTRHQRE